MQAGKQTIKHNNILAYVMPNVCWSAELSAFFYYYCVAEVVVVVFDYKAINKNSWINKQSFSIYMTNRFKFLIDLCAQAKLLNLKTRKHAVNTDTAGLTFRLRVCICVLCGEFPYKNVW